VTLRTALHEFVRDEVDISVSDAKLPIRPMMPHIVQRFVSGRTVQTMSNRRSLVPRRVQFTIYGNNDADVDAAATRLLRALDGYHGMMNGVAIGWAAMLMDVDAAPEEVKRGGPAETRYRRIVDFEVAYQEVASES